MKPAISFLFIYALIVATSCPAFGQSDRPVWTDTERPFAPEIDATVYRTVGLNVSELVRVLDTAPPERSADPASVLTLPLPDGSFASFEVRESPIMAPALASRYPEIRTFTVQGITDRRLSGRIDLTPAGFHAMIFSSEGTIYIDPFDRNTTLVYICYYKQDVALTEGRTFSEEGPLGTDSDAAREIRSIVAAGLPRTVSIGEELRTYRLAVGATGEYTGYHGGTVPAGMAAIVTAMNRVNGIYEREISVRMELVADNDLVVYTDPNTDPYTNNNGGAMLGQNQTTLDNVIGDSNYDVGHVFSTGGGGVAFLAVPCRSGVKAQGVTGLTAPIGDPFYVDYVAHEMGHQYGANHSFNGTAGSCSGNRWGPTAYEPGSASTIMGYAGICGGHNIQNNSDGYFHGISIDEMVAYTQFGSGNNCPVITSTGNTPPTADAGTTVYTIPLETPFMLTGSGSDIDGDTLTYCWEEFDLGPGGDPNNPSGNAPIFRSFDPTESTSRVFPQLSDILGGTQTIGEILPNYARTLNFRLTVRDNRTGGGGVADDATSVVVSGSAGPFRITYPDEPTIWALGGTDSVTWDVANTDIAPINVSSVNILLSTDGGETFPELIAANTPNDGHQVIDVPDFHVEDARIKVEAVGNIFFDINSAEILVSDLTTPVLAFPPDDSEDLPTEVELGWYGVSAATSYHVQVSIHVGFAFGFALDDSSYADTSVTVAGLDPDRTYYWHVKAKNDSGETFWSEVWSFSTNPTLSVTEDLSLPLEFSLDQNYPNPFNPSTTISYALPQKTYVRLEVFNLLGEQVALLVDAVREPGYHEAVLTGGELTSGVYLYRLTAGAFVQTKKLVLLR